MLDKMISAPLTPRAARVGSIPLDDRLVRPLRIGDARIFARLALCLVPVVGCVGVLGAWLARHAGLLERAALPSSDAVVGAFVLVVAVSSALALASSIINAAR